MTHMTGIDVFIMAVLILIIPKLVEKCLAGYSFSRMLRVTIIIGGVLWIIYSVNNELIGHSLGVRADDWEGIARVSMSNANSISEVVAAAVESGDYGRMPYIVYQSIFYLFGATTAGVLAINAFLAFWGGLALTRLVYAYGPSYSSRKDLLPLVLIFMPSVVFWCSTNLKEGLMYWSICQVFAFLMPESSRRQVLYNLFMFMFGAIIGFYVRSHIITPWIACVVLVKMTQPRWFMFIFGCFLLYLVAVNYEIVDYREITSRIPSIKQTIHDGEQYMRSFILRGKGSTFDYGNRKAIFVFDGFINCLSRPVFWKPINLRAVLSSIEIWTLSLSLIYLWIRMHVSEWKGIVRNPIIWVAFLVCIPFFLFFTYTVNEGLIVRQRVQVFPALLVMLATPILQRSRKGQRTEVGCQRSEVRM